MEPGDIEFIKKAAASDAAIAVVTLDVSPESIAVIARRSLDTRWRHAAERMRGYFVPDSSKELQDLYLVAFTIAVLKPDKHADQQALG